MEQILPWMRPGKALFLESRTWKEYPSSQGLLSKARMINKELLQRHNS